MAEIDLAGSGGHRTPPDFGTDEYLMLQRTICQS
jgi:hypothetical protein